MVAAFILEVLFREVLFLKRFGFGIKCETWTVLIIFRGSGNLNIKTSKIHVSLSWSFAFIL
jgi:hypothetical protein